MLATFLTGLRGIPRGTSLPREAWQRRHRGVLLLLAGHAVGLVAFGIAMGAAPLHAVLEGGLLGVVALVAAIPTLPSRARSTIASFGLMSSSAILTHLSGGYIEAHFHFFVMLGIIFLYEDWLPYVLSVAYVATHHGIMGTLAPESVFNHAGAIAEPWLWAGIHALFVMGLSAALIIAWGVIQHSRTGEELALEEARGLRRQLHAQEKMAALGSLVSGLAHEVRTPLTSVATNASLLELQARRIAPTAEARAAVEHHVREIYAGVDRMNALVRQLKRYHRLGESSRAVLPLDPLVQEAVELFRSAHKTGPTIRLDLQAPRPTSVDALGVQQVVLNLVANAVEAIAPDGEIVVRTIEQHDVPMLIVDDNGVGMSPEVAARIFEPLFTTKKEGMGLGLSIVKRIVDDHGGRIECISAPGKGTTFRASFGPRESVGRTVPILSEPSLARN